MSNRNFSTREMNWVALYAFLWLLVGCSEQKESESTADTVNDIESDSYLVEILPSYQNELLPEGLHWETNESDPVFSSNEAKRGGKFNSWILGFPLTLRTVGPDSNGSFATYTRANNLGLVGVHPNTLDYYPVLATHWAFGDDGRTVYYQLNENATWSDGEPVTADDFMFAVDFMRSEHIVAPWYNNHYTNVIVNISKYDDHTISIEGATAKPPEEMLNEYGLSPIPRHFHRLDENWVQEYNWRLAPTTGAYRISIVEKGQYVEFQRNENWWGDSNLYLRNRYNVDIIRFTVIRDMNVAWEYFLRGEIDSFPLVMPSFWHEKANGEDFDNGYIQKIKFYTDRPQPSYGMWMNMDDPILGNLNVRLGIAHATNVEKMLSTLLRGDYERLKMQFEGYGDYSNPSIQPREFDLFQADNYLVAAGFKDRGSDGIRANENGQRLAFRVVYGSQEHTPRLVLLREEAKKAGIELNLQLLDSSAQFKQILEKKHQIAWMGWSTGLVPRFWQYYHSDNAHIPQTNNITNTDDPELDSLIMRYRESKEKDERIGLAHLLQRMTHDAGAYIPTYKVPYTREAYWRWLKMPKHFGTRTTDTIFNPLGEALFWFDENLKLETMAAKQEGISYPVVNITDTTWQVD